MAFTSEEIAGLRSAIAKGEKTVTFADRSVTYRSIAELVEALRLAEAENASRPKQSLGYSSKGF